MSFSEKNRDMDKGAKIRMLDFAMAITAIIAIVVSVAIDGRWRIVVTVMFGIVFLVSAVRAIRSLRLSVPAVSASKVSGTIKLLDENARGIHDWDLNRQASLLIGKSGSDLTADIDLTGSAFAAMVENEHATLNFAAGEWYLEDVSKNSNVSLEKDGLRYTLSKGVPCILAPGDVIFVAQTKLLFV